MSNKTNFLIFSHYVYHYQLRIYCNDILVDEIIIEDGDNDALIKTKTMHHEDGTFLYKFEFTLLSGGEGGDSIEDNKDRSNQPIVLWHVLHNDHPMSLYMDTMNYTDIGWLKNRLWTNEKAHIYPGQTLSLSLNYRGGVASIDNEFLLKSIKDLKRLRFDMFTENDDTQIAKVPQEETRFVSVLDQNRDLTIKKKESEHDIMSSFHYTEEMAKHKLFHKFMQFVDRSCMDVHVTHSAEEYYSQYKI